MVALSAEAAAVEADKRLLADVSAKRVARGDPSLTPEQQAGRLQELAAKRAAAKSAASG
jgi:hypothetical protein